MLYRRRKCFLTIDCDKLINQKSHETAQILYLDSVVLLMICKGICVAKLVGLAKGRSAPVAIRPIECIRGCRQFGVYVLNTRVDLFDRFAQVCETELEIYQFFS